MRIPRALLAAGGITLLIVPLAVLAGGGQADGAVPGVVRIYPGVTHIPPKGPAATTSGPPTTAQCEAQFQVACYQPSQIQDAYNLAPLFAKGVDGKGETIIIVDSYGSPTIGHRPQRLRQGVRPACSTVAHGDPTGRTGTALRGQRQPGGMGRRDDPRRGVLPRHGSRRQHPAGRDPDVGERGHHRLSPRSRRPRSTSSITTWEMSSARASVRLNRPSRRRSRS